MIALSLGIALVIFTGGFSPVPAAGVPETGAAVHWSKRFDVVTDTLAETLNVGRKVHLIAAPVDMRLRFYYITSGTKDFSLLELRRRQADTAPPAVSFKAFSAAVERLPELKAAIQGMALCLKQPYQTLLRSFTPRLSKPAENCSAFLARTPTGELFLAGIADVGLSGGYEGAVITMVPFRPDGVAQSLIGNHIGAIGANNGMNAAGLAITSAGVAGKGEDSGPKRTGCSALPIRFVISHLLETCSTVRECRAWLLRTRYRVPTMSSSANVLFLDAAGEAMRVEFSPNRTEILYPAAAPNIACNHFDLMPEEQLRAPGQIWSYRRQQAIRNELDAGVCHDLDYLMALDTGPAAVCRHDLRAMVPGADPVAVDFGWTTLAFAFFPASRRAWFWQGQPGDIAHEEITLGRPLPNHLRARFDTSCFIFTPVAPVEATRREAN